jgi:hypothetical protein
MKISESIEAHLSAAVAAISQRNQATLPGFHKIIISPVFNIFRIFKAKAFRFCLFLYTTGAAGKVLFGKLNELKFFNTSAMRIV